MFGWLRKRQREQAFGEHIQTLSSMVGSLYRLVETKDDNLLAMQHENRTLRSELGQAGLTMDALLDTIDSLLYGDNKVTRSPDNPLFKLIFTTKQRIAIKRALQLIEDTCVHTKKTEKTVA